MISSICIELLPVYNDCRRHNKTTIFVRISIEITFEKAFVLCAKQCQILTKYG